MSAINERNLKFETLQLHVGQETADSVTDARAVPIYQTSSYVFHNSQHAADRFALKDAGNIYGRLTNPTEDVFERRIAALEGGTAALAVASGAAAVSYALQALAKAGDNIVAAKTIYGGTYNWLEHTFSEYGVTTKFVDPINFHDFGFVGEIIADFSCKLRIETFTDGSVLNQNVERYRAFDSKEFEVTKISKGLLVAKTRTSEIELAIASKSFLNGLAFQKIDSENDEILAEAIEIDLQKNHLLLWFQQFHF